MRTQALKIQPQNVEYHCDSCQFLTGCIIGNVPKEKTHEFSRSLTRYEIKRKGAYVFNQGQPNQGAYFLCSGIVKLVADLENGQEVILDLLIPASVIGANPLDEKITHKYSAVAISVSARIAYAKQGALESLIRSEPRITEALYHSYWQKLQRSYSLISHRMYDVRGRFLRFLAYYMSAFETIRRGEFLAVHLSRDELAQLVQTTPETISRLLHHLHDEGLVAPTTERGVIFIKSKILCELLDEPSETVGALM